MDAGGLVTDDVTNEMVKERLSRPDVAKGCILDGYPRTPAQAQYLDLLLHSLGRSIGRCLSYEVADEVLVERMSGRRSCPKCGTVYHVSQNPPKRDGYCDRDGAGLVQREDDRPETVRRRLAEYAVKTEPLRRFYRDRSLLAEIEGVGTPEGILAATKKVLGR
jgi:adenylate kinase